MPVTVMLGSTPGRGGSTPRRVPRAGEPTLRPSRVAWRRSRNRPPDLCRFDVLEWARGGPLGHPSSRLPRVAGSSGESLERHVVAFAYGVDRDLVGLVIELWESRLEEPLRPIERVSARCVPIGPVDDRLRCLPQVIRDDVGRRAQLRGQSHRLPLCLTSTACKSQKLPARCASTSSTLA